MSCFEQLVVKDLADNIGMFVEVNVEERNNFKNITKYLGKGTSSGNQGDQEVQVVTEKIGFNARPTASAEANRKTIICHIGHAVELAANGKIATELIGDIALKLVKLHRKLESI